MVVTRHIPKNDDSMVIIYWSTEECWETALGLVIEGYIMVCDHMLISILSMLDEPLEMLCAEAVDALAPWAGDLNAEDLQSPCI